MDNEPAFLQTTHDACSLEPGAAKAQALEWHELGRLAIAVTRLDRGVRMVLPASLATNVDDLARRERACCTFLNIEITETPETLVLDVTSDRDDAIPLLSAMAGVSPR